VFLNRGPFNIVSNSWIRILFFNFPNVYNFPKIDNHAGKKFSDAYLWNLLYAKEILQHGWHIKIQFTQVQELGLCVNSAKNNLVTLAVWKWWQGEQER
jgi:hypothetical protein